MFLLAIPQRKVSSVLGKKTFRVPLERALKADWHTRMCTYTQTLYIHIHTPIDKVPTPVSLSVPLLRPSLSLSGIFAPPDWACLSTVQTGTTLQNNTHTHTHTEIRREKGDEESKTETQNKKWWPLKQLILCLMCVRVCTAVCTSAHKCHCWERIM